MSTDKSKSIFHSLKNHLQISYGPQKLALRNDHKVIWNFTQGRCQRAALEWRAELELAAQQISTLAAAEVYLYNDGSFFSQVMAQAFKWAKLPFQCVTPRFKKDLNIHSFSQSVLFFETHDIPYQICEVDIDELFLSSDALQLSHKYSTDQPSQILAIKVWQTYAKLNKFIVLPFGLPRMEKHLSGWRVLEYEREFATYLYQKDQKVQGVPCFYKWSPELTFSFLHDPVIRAMVTNLRSHQTLNDECFKEIFQNYFRILGTHNWQGFEKISYTIKKYHQKLTEGSQAQLMAIAYQYPDYRSRLEVQNPATAPFAFAFPANTQFPSKSLQSVTSPDPAASLSPLLKPEIENLAPIKKGNIFYNQGPNLNKKQNKKTNKASAKKAAS